jgi:hypothetical protein
MGSVLWSSGRDMNGNRWDHEAKQTSWLGVRKKTRRGRDWGPITSFNDMPPNDLRTSYALPPKGSITSQYPHPEDQVLNTWTLCSSHSIASWFCPFASVFHEMSAFSFIDYLPIFKFYSKLLSSWDILNSCKWTQSLLSVIFSFFFALTFYFSNTIQSAPITF